MNVKRNSANSSPEVMLDLYVEDVVGNLPRSQRADIALELRSLLGEELEAISGQQGQPLDGARTLAFLRDFGHPKEVAVRYHQSEAVVAVTDTRTFLAAALVGVVVIAGLAKSMVAEPDSSAVLLAMFAWLGLLVSLFGIKNWIVQRWPQSRSWTPRDRERMSKTVGWSLVAVIGLGLLVYGAPSWVYAKLSGGGVLSDWFAYDASFAATRLPWLLAAWALQAILFAVVTVRGRWNWWLRRLEIALGFGLASIMLWCCWGSRVFVRTPPDNGARAILGIAVVVTLVDLAAKLYRGTWRRPNDSPPGSSSFAQTVESVSP